MDMISFGENRFRLKSTFSNKMEIEVDFLLKIVLFGDF